MKRTLASLIVITALLAGCVSQGGPLQEGRQLAEQGRYEEALPHFQAALREAPDRAEPRLAVAGTRERLARQWLEQADRAVQAGKRAEADALVARVLALDPANDAARRLQAALRVPPAEPVAEVPPPVPDAKLASALAKPVSIEFRDASLKQIFEVLARTSGINFVFDKDVDAEQKITIYLRRATVKEILAAVLAAQQLEQRALDTGTLLVYPNTPAKARDHQALSIKAFHLANADPKAAAATLRTLLKAKDVVVDEKQNMVVVRDTPEVLRLAGKLLAVHDQPEPEVMLEVEILEVKRSRLLDLGIRWPDLLSLTPLGTVAGGVLTLADILGANQRSLGATISPLTFSAGKADTDVNLLANPRIRTRNREMAKILIGDRVPNITTTATATGFVAESVQYVDVGLKLDVQPTITLDNEVTIRVNLEVSNIVDQVKTKTGTLAYQIGTRNASTVLRLKDGENQVLAGLINDTERSSGNRVPGLGDLPLTSRLFGSRSEEGQKTELMLSITPRLVRAMTRLPAERNEFDAGVESRLHAPAADLAAYTEVVPPSTAAGEGAPLR